MNALRDSRLSFSSCIWLILSLFILLGFAFAVYVWSENEVEQAVEFRRRSFLFADELRQSSDDLSRMARTYVLTGNLDFKNHYQAILDIRDGKAVRPAGYQRIYWDLVVAKRPLPSQLGLEAPVALLSLMREAGYSDLEFEELAKAKNNSDLLARRELEAMTLVESTGPSRESEKAKAREMLFDEEYHRAKAAIMEPINNVMALVEKRTAAAVENAQGKATVFRVSFVFVGVLLIGALYRANLILKITMGGRVDEVHAHMTRLGKGDFSSEILVPDELGDSVLGRLAQMRLSLKSLFIERQHAALVANRLALIVESSEDGIVSKDTSGKITTWNLGAEKLFGYTSSEMIGSSILRLIPLEKQTEEKDIQDKISTGQSVHHLETTRLRKDGQLIHVSVTASPIRDVEGRIVGVSKIARDISERIRMDRARKEEHDRLVFQARLLDSVGEAVIATDPNGLVIYWNHAAEQIYGWKSVEVMGRNILQITPLAQSREQAQSIMESLLGGSHRWSGVFQARHRDGHSFPVQVTDTSVMDANGKLLAIIGVSSDITAQQEAEVERQKLERKIQETQKLESLGVLAGGIAHDFNNILTGILGNASLAGIELPSGSPVQDNLETIKRASMRAADLCRQMLAYSGKGRFVVQNLNLNRLVEESTQLLQLSISKKAVLRFNLYPSLPAIAADATQIRQLVMNLVINASEAIGEKSGVIGLSTGLTRVDRDYLGGTVLAPELPEGTYVYLEISDSGCGMSPETQAKIFDPFFTTKFTGRGLGLAAVLGIVRGHKGTIRVYSELGRGTTFKLLFPCTTGDAEVILRESAPKAAWRGKGTVLVADDEESVRSTLALMFQKMGFSVAIAGDGREAVKTFSADPSRFALVLMDLTMPHFDGEQAFTEMRRIRPEMRVVLMSGFDEQEAVARFRGKGLAGFLQKPFHFDGLSELVQTLLKDEQTSN